MKILFSIVFLFFSFSQISCDDETNVCDKDGDGIVSRDCGGEDCNDGDKNLGSGDQDEDNHFSTECGGDDCDDSDAERFLSNDEVYDAVGHDEDCNPDTCGGDKIDNDGDGYGVYCFNKIDGVTTETFRGDCDDTNAAIFPGSQVCGTKGKILICTGNGIYLEVACGTCVVQPNGTGVCLN
jgi:hypothetical protein